MGKKTGVSCPLARLLSLLSLFSASQQTFQSPLPRLFLVRKFQLTERSDQERQMQRLTLQFGTGQPPLFRNPNRYRDP